MLKDIQAKLGGIVPATWAQDVAAQGGMVALYRDYAAGQHRAKLTAEMREMLRVSDARSEAFALNYCDMIIETMAARLHLDSIEGDTAAATEWADSILEKNRLDALQMDVHEAAIRDGVTYMMVAYDNDAGRPMLAHELAFDGETGLIAVYDRMGKTIAAAIKIWVEGEEKRVNLYWPGRVERYAADLVGASLSLRAIDDAAWEDTLGEAVGVPVVAFVNRSRPRLTTGISEIGGVIGLQDALNRTLVSMVMTAELTAFQIRVAIGFAPPAKLTPGMWVAIGEAGLSNEQRVDVDTMTQGQIVPFIDQAKFLIEQISTITSTPLPNALDAGASGEALKEREIRLLGKIKRFQVRGGNAWEDVLTLAARVQAAFGAERPPASAGWSARWADAEIRNDLEVVDIALRLRGLVGDRETLRLVGPIYGWDEAKIDQIMAQREGENVAALASLGGSLPGFAQFAAPRPEQEAAGRVPAGALVGGPMG